MDYQRLLEELNHRNALIARRVKELEDQKILLRIQNERLITITVQQALKGERIETIKKSLQRKNP